MYHSAWAFKKEGVFAALGLVRAQAKEIISIHKIILHEFTSATAGMDDTMVLQTDRVFDTDSASSHLQTDAHNVHNIHSNAFRSNKLDKALELPP